jgi:hypothetical protein
MKNVEQIIKEIDGKKYKLKENSRFVDIVKYCAPHADNMWAAKIISIVLDCDFRDAKREAERYLLAQEDFEL